MREENARVLEASAPQLMARVAAAELPSTHAVGRAPSGAAILSVGGTPLHNAADPAADGVRWARAAAERLARVGARRAIVVGFGLGYHVEALAERFHGRITVVEPDDAIWRCALASRDLSALLGRIEIADEPGDRRADGEPDGTALVLPYAPALLLPGGAHRRAVAHWQGEAARIGLRLKVLVVSPMYGGSWPIAGYAARALARLGHEASLLDLAPFHASFRELTRFGARRARRAQLESAYCDLLGDGVAAAVEAAQPDIVLALAQAPLGPRALEAIAAAGAVRALWFVEDFRLFAYWREIARHYDHVFAIQRGECIEEISAVTAGRVSYLPCAFDPEVHRPLDLGEAERAAFGSDVSFVGAGYHNRRRALRAFLDLDFRLWGSDWNGAADFASVLQRDGARISTEDAVKIFNATRVNLNLHSSTYCDGVDPRGDFVNPRTFELAGCGAFQIVDRRSLLPELFAPDREIATAASVAEMKDRARYFLAHPDERRAIAEACRRRALAEHTYEHRMRALLAAVVGSDQERFLARPRAVTVGDVRRREIGELDGFLARLDPATPFALDAIVRSVPEREGPLEDPEAIFLFLHQFDELYLTEHRA